MQDITYQTIPLFGISCLATEDYSAGNELLTFSAVSTRHDVVITINDDDINEIIEEFGASISFGGDTSDGILLVPDEATVQITDDDGMQVTKYICTYTSSFHSRIKMTVYFIVNIHLMPL